MDEFKEFPISRNSCSNVYLYFIDYAKVFKRVQHEEMIKSLTQFKIEKIKE